MAGSVYERRLSLGMDQAVSLINDYAAFYVHKYYFFYPADVVFSLIMPLLTHHFDHAAVTHVRCYTFGRAAITMKFREEIDPLFDFNHPSIQKAEG